MKKISLGIVIGFSTAALVAANAADYPTKSVRVIVPYAAGGANDLVARVYADAVSTALGQQLVIENRTGGAAGVVP